MKKIITTILGASLLTVTLYAQDSFEDFYPVEEDDTPDYLIDTNVQELNPVQILAKSSLSANTLAAFYPVENDDTPNYLKNY